MKHFTADTLQVTALDSRDEMGRAAAAAAAERLRALLAQQETVNVIFAAAPSQMPYKVAIESAKNARKGNIAPAYTHFPFASAWIISLIKQATKIKLTQF